MSNPARSQTERGISGQWPVASGQWITPLRGRRFAAAALFTVVLGAVAWAGQGQSAPRAQTGSRVIRDAEVAVKQPGTHDGGGMTTGYLFFEDVKDMPFYFRKRALHPGSGIGYHQQEQDEVYYVLSGTGEYTLDGKKINVGPGTALLTRKGSSHSLRQVGREDLVIIITYPRTPAETR